MDKSKNKQFLGIFGIGGVGGKGFNGMYGMHSMGYSDELAKRIMGRDFFINSDEEIFNLLKHLDIEEDEEDEEDED